jgi:uncharacterized protein (DUF305 family)
MKHLRRVALLGLLASAFAVSPAQATGPYDASSVMFAQMMVPHHQQAVLISKWALKQSSNASVKKLAARMIQRRRQYRPIALLLLTRTTPLRDSNSC